MVSRSMRPSKLTWAHLPFSLFGPSLLSSSNLPIYLPIPSPKIIINGSISAYSPRPNHFPYTMSKHAIAGLTKCLPLDGRQHDIACSQLDIGNAQTAISRPGGMLQPNGPIMVEAKYYDVEYADQAVVYMASLPLCVNVLNQTLMAMTTPFVGRG
ncbi:hypothetical protein EHS25_004915 [Saitozyma podzolica]|uniref:Uncharacterized protein n=1 Tax=Saitozyma podzolica TaxID=1890683 RepID=A0A427Y374_9TREE|nr:hypothetical protein EHS25_004915 [Saitozyma podzolica]